MSAGLLGKNFCTGFDDIFYLDSLFNGHFSRWTWVLEVLELRMMEVVVITGTTNTCKAPVKLYPPTNQHPAFLRAGCPSCRPTNSVKALNGKLMWQWISLSMYLVFCELFRRRWMRWFMCVCVCVCVCVVWLTAGEPVVDRVVREVVDEPWFLVVLVGVVVGLLGVIACVIVCVLYQRHVTGRKSTKQPVLDGRPFIIHCLTCLSRLLT